MQHRDQVSNAICELERLLGEHTRHLLLRGLHRAEAEREGLVERHRTAHRLRGQRRNLVTAAEVGGEVVDALGRDNGAVDVEADSLSSAQRGLRMRDAQPDARAHRERAAAEGRRSAKVKDLHKKWLLLVGYGSTVTLQQILQTCKPNFRDSGVYVPRSVDWHPALWCIISLIQRNPVRACVLSVVEICVIQTVIKLPRSRESTPVDVTPRSTTLDNCTYVDLLERK